MRPPLLCCALALALPALACSDKTESAGASGVGGAAGGAGATTSAGASGVATGGGVAGGSSGGGANSGGTIAGNDAGGSSPGGVGGDSTASPLCALTESGPIKADAEGQVIELLHIVSTSGPAIDVDGHSGVVIKNVAVEHAGGPGIAANAAPDLTIQDVSVAYTGAPKSGANPSDEHVNIALYGSAGVVIKRVRLSQGSSGIYLVESKDSELSFVEGHDFRGPFPRGQLVQWDKSDHGLLEDFSVVNPEGSWPEDNVNIYQSVDVTVRRGLIDGNNSPSGVGVIFDGGPSTGLVEDVDATHMGNGCFSDYAGGPGVVFRRTRCRDNVCEDQGRGVPLSNALMWCGHDTHTDLKIEASTYTASCNGNVVWPEESFATLELTEADFQLKPPLELDFCWE